MKKHTLVWLDDNLHRLGYSKRCFDYKLFRDKTMLFIAYLDIFLDEQFIFVFRTSRLCYRIYYNGKIFSCRTCKETTKFMLDILDDTIQKNDYYKTITIAELNELDKITHTKELELFTRHYKKLTNKND